MTVVKKAGLILSFSWIPTDPRVLRQISSLEEIYDLTVIGYGPYKNPKTTFVQLGGLSRSEPGQLVRFPYWLRLVRALFALIGANRIVYWALNPSLGRIIRFSLGRRYDFVLVNEVDTIPIGLRIAKGSPLLADLHEYTPGHLEPGTAAHFAYQRFRLWLCRKYLHRPNQLFTVAPSIAAKYAEEFGVPEPLVLPNAPRFQRLVPSPVNQPRIQLVYHGLGGRGRGLDVILDALTQLSDTHELHLYLVGDQAPAVREKTEVLGLTGAAFFHEPVPTSEISRAIQVHDLGVVLHEPISENHLHSLPNKFFETIQARLAVLIGPSPSMLHYVQHFGVGAVTPDFSAESLVRTLANLSKEEITKMKAMSHACASQLSWDEAEKTLQSAVERCT